MKSDENHTAGEMGSGSGLQGPEVKAFLKGTVGDSIDSLVEYMLANGVSGIHPLIMGEIERRLIIKALERTRGNKLRAAQMLGISRNTFHRKVRLLEESVEDGLSGGES
jgi:two-component system nitrogen regulation response regulator GlnG